MKNISIINAIFVLVFTILLSTSMLAQENPMKAHPENCTCENCGSMSESSDHKCDAECAANGCTNAVAVKESSATAKQIKHVCTDECHDKGCDYVKAKEARAALDVNGDGFIYECDMKCETADHAGECSKCGMELKKVSLKDS